MRGRALDITIIFMIAVPYVVMFSGTADTPDFVPIEPATVTTDNFSRKGMVGIHLCTVFRALAQQILNVIENIKSASPLYFSLLRILRTVLI